MRPPFFLQSEGDPFLVFRTACLYLIFFLFSLLLAVVLYAEGFDASVAVLPNVIAGLAALWFLVQWRFFRASYFPRLGRIELSFIRSTVIVASIHAFMSFAWFLAWFLPILFERIALRLAGS
ncbi:hypothetical protein A2801_01595 [Candidatus Woesebacteria bacterium RIFCSPHIGHO2_01_FULL_41_10]|uniref:Uncharacterized protein n=1 Tax=Candidatus Woesebacteria bacterium RIFCSPHIGHO2_01_FULL_41_10 TaxID=1802500 RepID=A0A1F7YQ00_9BACT|nr:MAG: hypothetical protein A2801_01595 [Candidatus Woesebacteria bacterium RIFCSPHIGHO2_01_FULL_41_10]